MSGQIVGEVLAAAAMFRQRGLPPRAFYALIAIAEKANTHNRQASVRWDHIRAALYGASKRTAERAVHDLTTAELVTVVKPGFNNLHGRICAPVYQIVEARNFVEPVTDSGSIQQITDADNQMSVSVPSDADNQMSVSVASDPDNQMSVSVASDADKSEGRYRHPGVVLDVSLDGKEGGEPYRGTSPVTPPPALNTRASFAVGKRPSCPEHAQIPAGHRVPACTKCQRLRKDAEAMAEAMARPEREQRAAEQERRAAFWRDVQACMDCDDRGFVENDDGDLSRCPNHAWDNKKSAS